ncbi:uncharacterized protein M6G45_016219 [Spheniscus humboldti]
MAGALCWSPSRGAGSARCPEGEGCKLCPTGWTLRGTKCYQDCVNWGAELLMPGDQDELGFVKEVVWKPTRYFWIGLSVPSAGKGWTWLNGSHLDQGWRRDRTGTLKRLPACHHPEDTLGRTIRGCQPASTRCRGNAASQRGLKSLEPVGNRAGRAEIVGLPDVCTHCLSLGPSAAPGSWKPQVQQQFPREFGVGSWLGKAHFPLSMRRCCY